MPGQFTTTSSSGTRSLQFLWHVNTHFRQHTFSCSLQYVWYFSRCSSQNGLIEIRQTRLAINGYLDKLEKELLTKLQEARDNSKGQILELVATLAKQETEIIECQDNLQNKKSYATDLLLSDYHQWSNYALALNIYY
jgi:hypothetical protein